MKRKYAAMILGLTMTLTSVNMAYAATDTTTEAAADETADSEDASATTDNSVESTEVYGEVTAVGEDSITINVGTLKEGQQPGDSMDAPDGEAPSMLDLTGASQEIKVTDTTTYEKQAAPEKTEDGQAPQDGEKPEDTDASDSSDADSKDEKADDTTDAENTDETETDSADAKADDTKAADKSDDQKPEDGQAPEMKTEAIALTDIQVGDTIKVTLDADGNATAVVVMNAGAPEDVKDADTKAADKKDETFTEDSSADSSDSTDSTTDAE